MSAVFWYCNAPAINQGIKEYMNRRAQEDIAREIELGMEQLAEEMGKVFQNMGEDL